VFIKCLQILKFNFYTKGGFPLVLLANWHGNGKTENRKINI